MATVEYSGLINYISGKLGCYIFSRNRGTNYIKMSADSVYHRNTARQLQVKSNFKSISKLWKDLPIKYQIMWNDHATSQNKRFYGNQLFRQYNCNLLNASHANLSTISYPPSQHKNPEYPKNFGITKLNSSNVCLFWNSPLDQCFFITGNYKLHSGFCTRHPSFGCCVARGYGDHWRFISTFKSSENHIVMNHDFPSDTLLYFKIRSIDHYGRVSPWTHKIRLLN